MIGKCKYFSFLPACIVVLMTVTAIEARWNLKRIEFKGNVTFSRRELLSKMVLHPSFWYRRVAFTPYRLSSDIRQLQALYSSQGFLHTAIDDSVVRDSARRDTYVTISIKEGTRIIIDSVNITGLPPGVALTTDFMTTRTSAPLIYPNVNTDTRSLIDSLGSRGFLAARVDPQIAVDTGSAAGRVVFMVKSGPRVLAGDVTIKGLSTVADRVVGRELAFKKGSVLTNSKIDRSIERLYQTRLFNYVDIRPIIGDSAENLPAADTALPVLVTAGQARYFNNTAGIGYDAYQLYMAALNTSYANLWRIGHEIALQGTLGGVEQSAQATYATPWLFFIPLRTQASLYYRRHDTLFVNVPLAYKGRFYGSTLSFGNTYPRGLSYSMHFKYETVMNVSVPPIDTLIRKIPTSNTRSIGADVTSDQRDDLYNPSRGYYDMFSVTIAGLGGSAVNHFIKATNNLRGYFTFGNIYFSSALTLGAAHPYSTSVSLPVQEQFFAGGSLTVRGYDYESLVTTPAGEPLGGNVELIVHIINIRFPLFWIINGAVFSDAGYVWQDFRSVNLRDIKYTAGPGLRLMTPVGLIRLDVGFKLDKLGQKGSWKAYLDIGQPF